MLISQIIESGFPILAITDKASTALQLMEDYDVVHLPVSGIENRYAGLISKDDLLDVADTISIQALEENFIRASVLAEEHFLSAVKIAAQFEISVVPVVTSSGEISGVISSNKLLQTVSSFLNLEEPGGMIVIELDKRNFSFGELSRLVETNNAFITHLNSFTESATGLFIVTIKLNKIEISDIIATLQRYDYSIRYYFGEEEYENELKENYELLMTYLKI